MFFATVSGKGHGLNCNGIAHKVVIVGQIRTSVYTAKTGENRLSITHKLSTEKEPELDVS